MGVSTNAMASLAATEGGGYGSALQRYGLYTQGLNAALEGYARDAMAKADAAGVRDVGKQQARQIMRTTRRAVGSVRAATAASGARIDQFSTPAEAEVDMAGETDAALALLGAENQARGIEMSGKAQRARGIVQLGTSVFEANFSGWRGAKGFGTQLDSFYTGTGRSGD